MPKEKKPLTVGSLMKKGHAVIGLHVMTRAWVDGDMRDLIGTVKDVSVDRSAPGYSSILLVDYFNGQPWPFDPYPWQVYVIERE